MGKFIGCRGLIILILLFTSFSSIAQNHYSISGTVKDAASGDPIIGANVYLKELMKGTTSDQNGAYSMSFEKAEYTIIISYIGYQEIAQKINLNKNLKLNFQLKETGIMGKEVIITGDRPDQNVQSTDMGRVKLDIEQIRSIPAFMGEVDIMKTLQLLPGIQSAGEGNSGFYVRGGGPDQNLILLDDAVVYNASHLFGFFSIFNSDAVDN
nr:TonB-dependent receptor [Bacteroidota bacterium]